MLGWRLVQVENIRVETRPGWLGTAGGGTTMKEEEHKNICGDSAELNLDNDDDDVSSEKQPYFCLEEKRRKRKPAETS